MAKNLKAYLRYTGDGRIVPGGNISSRQAPKVGRWEEIDRDTCCPSTTTTTEYVPQCATYSVVVGDEAIVLFYTDCNGDRSGPHNLNPEAEDTFCCIEDTYEVEEGADVTITFVEYGCSRPS